VDHKPKILLIHTGTAYGGIDRYLVNLVSLLRKQCEFYAFCSSSIEQADLSDLGTKGFYTTRPRCFGKWLSLFVCLTLFPVLIYSSRIEIVWCQGGIANIFIPLARLFGCLAVATQHATLEAEPLSGFKRWKHGLSEIASRKLLSWADRIICVSDPVASAARKIVHASKVAMIANWVKLPTVDRAGFLSKDPNLRVLFVGRLERHKDVSVILRAMRILAQERGRCIELTVVGTGSYEKRLKNEADGLPVRFVGFQKDPSQFYRQADLYINPSLGPEGLPLASLEAMSFGTPSIFSDLPIHCLLMRGHQAGLLFRQGDAGELAEKIAMMSAGPLARRLTKEGRKLVELYYSETVARGSYLNEIATLCNASTSR
jgi:glycosyltransferase involved in cell wall biosynthesis